MERKCLKMDSTTNPLLPSFSDHYNYSINNDQDADEKNNPLGFMELLNMQDFGPYSIFDVLASTEQPNTTQEKKKDCYQLQQESPELLNAPATPNYSSISSESVDGQGKIVEPEEDDEDGEEEEQKTKKELKAKKTSIQKKTGQKREPRFAFMTKSEVDHLEDGYRWRKYGQKAVKNSPFPRSYYRCTTASCNVKKRVERSFNDPSIVVTTYEGQHTHPSPTMPRSSAYSGFTSGGAASFHDQMLVQPQWNYPVTSSNVMNSGGDYAHQNNMISSAMLQDIGLLQDIVPWSCVKKEDK